MNRIIAPIITKYTDQYIEGIDAKNLQMSVFGGAVELTNLKVKKSALAELNLPVDVVRGTLSKLAIKVPWTNLSGQAVEVKVDELLLLAKPKGFGRKSLFVRWQPRATREPLAAHGKVQIAGLDVYGEGAAPLKIVSVQRRKADGSFEDVSLTFLDRGTGQWKDRVTYMGSTGDSLVVQLENPAIVQGYRVRTCADSTEKDPVAWDVDGSARLKGPFYRIHAFSEERETHRKRRPHDPPLVTMPRQRQTWTDMFRELQFRTEEPAEDVIKRKRQACDTYAATLDIAPDADEQDAGFAERLQETIVNNIQIEVNTIHIRYEDDISCPANPHVSGMYLKKLRVHSTGEDWQQKFMTTVGDLVRKAAVLEGLGVYMDHQNTVMTADMAEGDWKAFMVRNVQDVKTHEHMLSPLSLDLHLKMKTSKGKKKRNLKDVPAIEASVDFHDLAVGFNRAQVVSSLQAVKFVESYSILDRYVKFRPNYPVIGHAKQWWWFAKRSIIVTLRQQKKPTDRSVKGRQRIKRDYVNAYVKTHEYPWQPKVDKTTRLYKLYKRALDGFDFHLPQDELLLLRAAVHAWEKAEQKSWEAKSKRKEEKLKKAKSQQSWGSWLVGSTVEVSDDEDEEEMQHAHGLVIDAEARQQLMDSIGFSADEEGEGDLSPRKVDKFHSNTTFDMHVRSMRLTLAEKPGVQFGELEFNDIRVGVNVMEAASATMMTIQDFTVKDSEHARSIIAVRESEGVADGSPVFSLMYEVPPRDGQADSALLLRTRGLDLWFDAAWLSRVMWLVQIPSEVNLGAIEAAAKCAVAEIGESATRGLLQAIEERQSIAIDMNVEGPRIHIPYKADAALEVNLGTLTLLSTADKARKTRIMKGQATEEDYYDVFKFNLDGVNTAFMRSEAEQPIAAAIHARSAVRSYLLSDVGFQFEFANCLTPDDDARTSAKLDGEFTPLNMMVSPGTLNEFLMGLGVLTTWIANPTGTHTDTTEDHWRGRVTAVAPKFVAPEGGAVHARADGEEWEEFDATFIPRSKMLYLEQEGRPALGFNIGASTDVKKEVGGGWFGLGAGKGEDTVTVRLPQGATQRGAYIELKMKMPRRERLPKGTKGVDSSAQGLCALMTDAIWAAREWKHEMELNRVRANARALRAAEDAEEVSSPREEKEQPATKVTMDLALRMPRLALDLLEADGTPVLGVSVTALEVAFTQRPRDQTVSLSLAGCSVDEKLLMGADGRSPVLLGFQEAESVSQGIQLTYISAMDGSPYPWREAENTGIRLDFSCPTLLLDSERNTLPTQLGYVVKYADVMPESDIVTYAETEAPREDPEKVQPGWFETAKVEEKKQPATVVSLALGGFRGVFRNDREEVFSLSTARSGVQVHVVPDDAMTVDVTCGNFNLNHHADDNKYYKQLVASHASSSSLLEVKYIQRYGLAAAPDTPIYASSCKVRFGQCTVVYLQRTIGQLARYFDVGHIMKDMSDSTNQALLKQASDKRRQAAEAAQAAAVQASTDRANALELMSFDIVIEKPVLVVPFAYDSDSRAELVVGTLGFATSLASKGAGAHVEVMNISLTDTSLKILEPLLVSQRFGAGAKSIITDWSIKCVGERVIKDPSDNLPAMQLRSTVGDIAVSLSKHQYEALMIILNSNVLDTWLDNNLKVVQSVAVVDEAVAEAGAEAKPAHADPKADVADKTGIAVDFGLTFDELSVSLEVEHHRGSATTKPLLHAYLRGLSMSHVQTNAGGQDTTLRLEAIGVTDTRPAASPSAKDLFTFGVGADEVTSSSCCAPPLLKRVAEGTKDVTDVHLPSANVTLIPGLVGETLNFFVSAENEEFARQGRAELQRLLGRAVERGSTSITESSDSTLVLTEDLFLGPENKLLALKAGELTIDGQGEHNVYLTGDCACSQLPLRPLDKLHYAIVLGEGTTLTLKNTTVFSVASVEDYVLPGGDGSVVLDKQTCKWVCKKRKEKAGKVAAANSQWSTELHAVMPKGFAVHIPEDCDDPHSRKLVLRVEGDFRMSSSPGCSQMVFESRRLTVFPTHMGGGFDTRDVLCNNLLGPAQLKFTTVTLDAADDQPADQQILFEGRNMNIRVTYRDVKLAQIVNQKLMAALTPAAADATHAAAAPAAPEEDLHVYAPLLTRTGAGKEVVVYEKHAPPSTSNIRLSLDSLSLLMLDDQQGYERDLMRFCCKKVSPEATQVFEFKMAMETDDKGAQVYTGAGDLRFGLDLFNHGTGLWEPVIEEHTSSIGLAQKLTGRVDPPTVLEMSVTAMDALNINVSQDSMVSLLQVSADWQKGLFEEDDKSQSQRSRERVEYRYTLLNQTGLRLDISGPFASASEELHGPGRDTVTVKSAPFMFNVGDEEGTEGGMDINIHFGEGGTRPVRLMETEAMQMVMVPQGMLYQAERVLMVRTWSHRGRSYVTLTSRYLLENCTGLPLEMKIQGAAFPMAAMGPDAGAAANRMGIPLWALANRADGIAVRSGAPEHRDYMWSSVGGHSSLSLITRDTLPFGTMMCGYKGNDAAREHNMCFVYNLVRRQPLYVRTEYEVIQIKAPLLLENLLPVPVRYSLLRNPNDAQACLMVDLAPGETREYFGATQDDELHVVYHIQGEGSGQDFDASKPVHIQSALKSKAHLNRAHYEHNTSVVDSATSRRLNLRLMSCVGGARAHREISLYCHYWIVNLSSVDVLFVRDEKSGCISNGLVRQDPGKEGGKHAPVLFSGLDDSDPFDGKIGIGMFGHERSCSAKFSQDVVGMSGEARCRGEDFERRFGVSISIAPGKHVRSKIIRITDRWMFRNSCGTDIIVRRALGAQLHKQRINDGETTGSIVFANGADDEYLTVAIADEEAEWRTPEPVLFANVGTQYIQLRHPTQGTRIIDLQMTQVDSVNYVVFKKAAAPPWKIINNTSSAVVIGSDPVFATTVPAFKHAAYYPAQSKTHKKPQVKVQYRGWTGDVQLAMGCDHTLAGQGLSLRVELGYESLLLVFEELERHSLTGGWVSELSKLPFSIKSVGRMGGTLEMEITCLDEENLDKRARAVLVGNKLHASGEWLQGYTATYSPADKKLLWGPDGSDHVQATWVKFTDFEVGVAPHTTLAVRSAIGMSMIVGEGDLRRELAYLSLGDVALDVKMKRETMDLRVKVGSMQLDDQQANATYPVLFTTNVDKGHMENTKEKKKRGSGPRDAFDLNITDYSTRIGGMTTAHSIMYLLQEVELQLTDTVLFQLLDFFSTLTVPGTTAAGPDLHSTICTYTEYDELLHSSGGAADQMYVDTLLLNPMKFIITFQAEGSSANEDLAVLFSSLTMSLTNIEDGVLKLPALKLPAASGLLSDITATIVNHYVTAALKGAYSLIGALDFIGNPVGLFSNFGEGVADLFWEPYNGITESPQEFAEGLGRGVASLGRHAVYGVVQSVGGVTGSVGDGLTALTFDRDYIKGRRKRQRQKVTNVGEGAVQGVTAFGRGIFDGLTGIVLKPIEGAKSDDKLKGISLGVGKGLIGAPVKIVGGVFDMVNKTMEGVKSSVSGVKDAGRARPPRTFVGGVIRPYDPDMARAWYMMDKLELKDNVIALLIPAHVNEQKRLLTIFSNEHMILFDVDGDKMTTRNVVPFSIVRSYSIASQALVKFALAKGQEFNVHIGGNVATRARLLAGLIDLCNKLIPTVPMASYAFENPSGGRVTTWEHERRYDEGYSKVLMPWDPPVWSDEAGKEERQKAVFRVPPGDLVWKGDWTVVTGDDTDAHGWHYAEEFHGAKAQWHADTSCGGRSRAVRRRQWVREYTKFEEAAKNFTHIPTASGTAGPGSPRGMESSQLSRHFDNAQRGQQATEERAVYDTYENQRFYPIVGWSTKLLPTDGPKWSCKRRKQDRKREKIDGELPAGWQWAGGWQIERSPNTDKDGWTYAVDFPFDWHAKKSSHHCARRRRWFREAYHPAEKSSAHASTTFV